MPPSPRACKAFSSRSLAVAETLPLFIQFPTSLWQPGRRMGSVRHVPFIRHLNSRERWPWVSAGPHAQSNPATAGAGASHSSPSAVWAGFAFIKNDFWSLCGNPIKDEASRHLSWEVGRVGGGRAPQPRSPFPATWSGCARNPCNGRGGATGVTLPAAATCCRATSRSPD